jgi:hypothetical protein
VGVERLRTAIGQAGSAMEKEAKTVERKKRGKRGRVTKAEAEAFQVDAELCRAIIAAPDALARQAVTVFVDDEEAKAVLLSVWETDPEAAKLAGSALHVLAVRHADWLIEHAPVVILATVFGGGLILKTALTLKVIRELRRRRDRGERAEGPRQNDVGEESDRATP